MILVTFAVPFESAVFRKAIGDAPGIEILHTGVGSQFAVETVSAALETNVFSHVIVSGFAGGLVEDLSVGDLITTDERESPVLAEQRSPGRVVRLVESSSILFDERQKRAFAESTGGQAVDMETATILGVCRDHGISSTVMRVISDEVSSNLVVPSEILADAADRPFSGTLRLLSYLLPRPSKWGAFRNMVANCSKARKILARGLEEVLAQIEA